LNWKTDPEEIVRVALRLIEKGAYNKGRRTFFFQCLGRYYNKTFRTFKWGHHLQEHHWNLHGEKMANQDDNASLKDLNSLAYFNSMYSPYYQIQVLDYLLEAHSL